MEKKASNDKNGNGKRKQWTSEEDKALKDFVTEHGIGPSWKSLSQNAGLKRCGRSCRARWLNYLNPGINHGAFTEEEDYIICTLFKQLGSSWSVIATYLPGRTDQHIKNHFRTRLSKKLMLHGPPSPETHAPVPQIEFWLPDFKETVDFFVMSPARHQFLDPVVAADELASDEWIECFDSQFWCS